MNRRSFILLTGAGISAVGVFSVKLLDLGFADENLYAKPKLLSRLCDDSTIRLLGRTYLKMSPPRATRNELMITLYGRVIKTEAFQRQDLILLREQLENSIKADFALGRTIVLNGWVLSITEARQCALYSILNS
jgi:hypothetical protein